MYDGLRLNLGIAKIRIFVLAVRPLGEFTDKSEHCSEAQTTQEREPFN